MVTGGGSQLKHITQLFEFITGIDTRIGYPTEHLGSSNTIENLTSPMYSTGNGLVLKGFQSLDVKQKLLKNDNTTEKEGQKNEKEKPVPKESRGPFFKSIFEKLEGILKEPE